MKVINVIRNGETKLRVPAEIRNGILRSGKNILINNDLILAPWTKEKVAAEIKAGRVGAEIEAMGMKHGDNGNGLICKWEEEMVAERETQERAEYNALPQDVRDAREERNAIEQLYAAAYKSEHRDTDDNNINRAMMQRGEATQRLAAWRAKYPVAAREEDSKGLLAKAEKEESLAKGALVYDADGWLSHADQEKSHDEHMAKATEYRKQAGELK